MNDPGWYLSPARLKERIAELEAQVERREGLLGEVIEQHKRTLWGQSETYKRIEEVLKDGIQRHTRIQ